MGAESKFTPAGEVLKMSFITRRSAFAKGENTGPPAKRVTETSRSEAAATRTGGSS